MYKNDKNRLKNARVIVKNKVAPFLRTRCIAINYLQNDRDKIKGTEEIRATNKEDVKYSHAHKPFNKKDKQWYRHRTHRQRSDIGVSRADCHSNFNK